MTISDDSRDYGKFTDGATHDPEKAHQDCFQKWQWRWERCINPGGEYFEGNKAHSVADVSERIIKK
jgi:broad specificity phosphatase PhoE